MAQNNLSGPVDLPYRKEFRKTSRPT